MSTYQIAINEYNPEDDDGKHKLIYAYFGLAVYIGQCLEETFSMMLFTDRIIKNKVKTNKEVNEIIDLIDSSKKTMGAFINEVKQSYLLSDELRDKLAEILERRNYLVHKYFKSEIQKFASELGQKEMLNYFSNFIDDSKNIDNELKPYYSEHLKYLGITEEMVNKMIDEIKSGKGEV
ncbi:MAG: hypothetical protein PHI47_00905 [Sulfuricurvum sp.]|uniref:hypothetical protein n=1 Tax=Sulfuricurvum sp. TaxID=2025608 RepID=UPI00261C112F|nr:hypothetical protein [Sulfuricurvum sp.]MDD5158578.1 hypothetical protein [Sulfuricurvum sp.]